MAKRKSKEIPISFGKSVEDLSAILYRMAEAFQQAIPTPEAVAAVSRDAVVKELEDVKARIARLEGGSGEKRQGQDSDGAGAEAALKQVRVRLAVIEKKFEKAMAALEQKSATAPAPAARPVDTKDVLWLLQSDEVKEFFDDRFKAFRTWLKTEEIPKIVKDALAAKAPPKGQAGGWSGG